MPNHDEFVMQVAIQYFYCLQLKGRCALKSNNKSAKSKSSEKKRQHFHEEGTSESIETMTEKL